MAGNRFSDIPLNRRNLSEDEIFVLIQLQSVQKAYNKRYGGSDALFMLNLQQNGCNYARMLFSDVYAYSRGSQAIPPSIRLSTRELKDFISSDVQEDARTRGGLATILQTDLSLQDAGIPDKNRFHTTLGAFSAHFAKVAHFAPEDQKERYKDIQIGLQNFLILQTDRYIEHAELGRKLLSSEVLGQWARGRFTYKDHKFTEKDLQLLPDYLIQLMHFRGDYPKEYNVANSQSRDDMFARAGMALAEKLRQHEAELAAQQDVNTADQDDGREDPQAVRARFSAALESFRQKFDKDAHAGQVQEPQLDGKLAALQDRIETTAGSTGKDRHAAQLLRDGMSLLGSNEEKAASSLLQEIVLSGGVLATALDSLHLSALKNGMKGTRDCKENVTLIHHAYRRDEDFKAALDRLLDDAGGVVLVAAAVLPGTESLDIYRKAIESKYEDYARTRGEIADYRETLRGILQEDGLGDTLQLELEKDAEYQALKKKQSYSLVEHAREILALEVRQVLGIERGRETEQEFLVRTVDEKNELIASTKHTFISQILKRPDEKKIHAAKQEIREEEKLYPENEENIDRLTDEHGMQLVNQEGRVQLQHPEYGITVKLTQPQDALADSLAKADADFEKAHERQKEALRRAEDAGIDVKPGNGGPMTLSHKTFVEVKLAPRGYFREADHKMLDALVRHVEWEKEVAKEPEDKVVVMSAAEQHEQKDGPDAAESRRVER